MFYYDRFLENVKWIKVQFWGQTMQVFIHHSTVIFSIGGKSPATDPGTASQGGVNADGHGKMGGMELGWKR